MNKNNRKIDIYYLGDYVGSTTWSKTCKEAKARFLKSLESEWLYSGLVYDQIRKNPEHVKTYFSKEN